MANFFDQFDVAPTGATTPPQLPPDVQAGAPIRSSGGNYFDQFDTYGSNQTPNQRVADVFSQFPQATPLATGVAAPFVNFGDIYSQMRGQAGQDITQGLTRALGSEAPISEQAKGLGQAALGGLGYIASPINAAYRSFVGQPVQDVTGIPAQYTDLAAQLATPGIGFAKMPETLAQGFKALMPAATTTKAAVPTAEQLISSAQAGYRAPELAQVELKPTGLTTLAGTTMADLNKAGFDENLAPKTFGILNKMTKAPDEAIVTVNNLESVRRMLGKAAGSLDPTERAAAMTAKTNLDKYVENLPQTGDVIQGPAEQVSNILTQARGNYAAAMASKALDARIAKAEQQTSGEGSGLNLTNKLRQQARQFLDSKDSRGLNDVERTALEGFIAGTLPQNVLRFAGNFLGGGGGLGSLATTMAGAMAGGPIGAVAGQSTGLGLRLLSNALTSRQADKLSELLRSRSPLANQMQASLDSWHKYAQAAQSSPATPRIFSMLTIQSRNLSNNLKDAGISISPNDIMKSLTGPMPSAADQQQNP